MIEISRRGLAKLTGAVALVPIVGGISQFAQAAPLAKPNVDPQTLVDPELRRWLGVMKDATANAPPWTEDGLHKMRTMYAPYIPQPTKDVSWEERSIPGMPGQPAVKIYIINASVSKPGRPAILHFHGGGFVIGTAFGAIRELQDYAVALDCVIVTVDYRLAPETTWRGSLDDNYAGLKWLYANAASLGADPKRIAVMGDSAGGGHAALLAIAARSRREVPVCFQLLIYPMLDDRTGSSRDPASHIGAIGWTREANRFGWRCFLGMEPGRSDVPVAAVPARCLDLSDLPPTWIGVGAIDLFVDENIEYARRMVNSGVPCEFHIVPGAFHGFDHAIDASVSKQFNDQKLVALRRAFARS